MSEFRLDQNQLQSLSQTLSQRQIHALHLLTLNSADLAKEIQKEADENPALKISERGRNFFRDGTKVSQANFRGEEESDKFLSALESTADERTSLQEHLMRQINMTKISSAEKNLCEKIIYNLDDRGFHILSPVSLLDKKNKFETVGLLEKCMEIVQQLEPSGICVKNFEESLFVQAKQRDDAPLLALYILDGNLKFLDPPKSEKIAQKIQKKIDDEKKLFAFTQNPRYKNLTVNEAEAERALKFIRTLEPNPARNFSSAQTHFVSPDVYVEEAGDDDSALNDEIAQGKKKWKIRLQNESFPKISLNENFLNAKKSAEEKKDADEKIRRAKEFIENLKFRENTVLKAAKEIVLFQEDFFLNGPGNLVPLKMNDVAKKIGVHETTISRMSNAKFLQCGWGLFDIKYFFTHAAGKKNCSASREKVMAEIKKILEQNETDGKKLSDLKIKNFLEKKGMNISRRTVTKYRALLNIGSSYKR
jgi:RNA polymerase sigma-54 factor